MKAVQIKQYGPPDMLAVSEVAEPEPGPTELLVRVRAVGVNRADALQRAGHYPPPAGESDIPGLELAGEVVSCGPEVRGFEPGKRVFGLVASGAYAEYARVDARLALPIPDGWSFVDAAALIEVFCTANETIFTLGGLQGGEAVLIHAAASGVGTAAVQMAKHVGATVIFTAGSEAKIEKVKALGGDHGINYRTHDFVEEVLRRSGGRGVDLVEDFIGAAYLMRNLSVLDHGGRLVLVGLMGGSRCDYDLAGMLRKRLRILGFTLRSQPIDNKAAIVGRFAERWLPELASGTIKPIVHGTYPLHEAHMAHAAMEANENFGKLILTVD